MPDDAPVMATTLSSIMVRTLSVQSPFHAIRPGRFRP
jgi:hypothetical protein